MDPRADGHRLTETAEAFLSLVCADDELVRLEFEALVAQAWPVPPPPRTGAAAACATARPGVLRRPVPVVTAQAPAARPGVGEWARQRSPPALG